MPNWTKEQLEAIEKDGCNIIVSAGAGSGKTAVLSERVIRKLKEGVKINELLILTFTNFAAKEMKERIRNKISKIDELKEQLNLLDSAYITTFDSYALSIVKKYHYLLNVSPDISIIDSNLITLEKEKIIDEIFEGLYRENNREFTKLLNDFTTKDDKEIRDSILKISTKLDLLTNKDEYLKTYINTYYSDENINKSINDFNNLLQKKLDNIKEIIYSLSFYVEGEYQEKLNNAFSILLNSKNYDDIVNNLDIKLPNLPKNSSEEAKTYKKEISETLKQLTEICHYNNEKEIYKSINLTKDYVIAIIDIIKKLDQKIMKYKFENDLYEFNDIAFLAINLLKENDEIREEIKDSLKEIMVDEYQDTNDIQEEFINLISNNNIYMVGDIKQSIYRFRNANPHIFRKKYNDYSKNINGYKIDLNKNFRSREEVLNNINLLFESIMNENIGGANYKESHKMIFGNDAYNSNKVNQTYDFGLLNYEYDKESEFKREEYEIFLVGNDIKNKVTNHYKIYDKDNNILRDCTYSDFVILMDRATNFDLYKKVFEYLKIPLSILKEEKVNDEFILMIVKNILNILVKIDNKEYDTEFRKLFTSILRSPLVNESDENIFNVFYDNSFFNHEIFKKLELISKNINSLSCKNIIEIIIDEFNLYEKLITIGNIKENIVILDYIIEIAENLLEFTITDFLEYLNTILEKGYDIKFPLLKDENNSVKIMTIHKSKGLEYYICYYTGLYKEFNISDIKERFIYDKKYGIITPYFDEGINFTIYKDLIKEDFIKEEISEKLRLFYVALTRAKEKMILICDLNKETNIDKKSEFVEDSIKLKYKSFNDILLSLKDKLNKYIKEVKVDNLTKDYNLKKNKKLEFNINKKDDLNVIEIEKDNEMLKDKTFSKHNIKLNTLNEIENMNFGTHMHYMFELIDFKNPNLSLLKKEEKSIIEEFLKNDLLKNIKNANIFKEYEFMYKEDNVLYHGIIDLMLEYFDHIDIIDYKLKNTTDENYIKQLNGYKNYIENKLKKEVNIYLYSMLDKKIVDLNYQEIN